MIEIPIATLRVSGNDVFVYVLQLHELQLLHPCNSCNSVTVIIKYVIAKMFILMPN